MVDPREVDWGCRLTSETLDRDSPGSGARPTWHAHRRVGRWQWPAPSPRALAFHRGLEGYAPTPLRSVPTLAAELGVAHVLVKDESSRLGLPAFKGLGASWAIECALQERHSSEPVTFVTATDGNHGRAVARFARRRGHHARILVPRGVHPQARADIAAEGAQIVEIDGSYDDAVSAAARLAAQLPGGLLLQDTAWGDYQDIPARIVEGYATLFAEVDDQIHAAELRPADVVFVPAGVGSLVQAALAHYRASVRDPAVVSVEPVVAGCVLASLQAGASVTVATGPTIMAGLNCGTPSEQAWPLMLAGLDGAILVSDDDDIRAARDLASAGIAAGPCGAAGLAGARRVLADGSRRMHLGITDDSVVVLIVTEGSAANPLPDIDEAIDR